MNSWQEELNKIKIEPNPYVDLNNKQIDKEIKDNLNKKEVIQNGVANHINSVRSRRIHRIPNASQEGVCLISTFVKEKKQMITAKGIFSDYEEIGKEPVGVPEKIWKFLPKIVKVLLNIRTNQVMIMDKLGIERKKVEKQEEEYKDQPSARAKPTSIAQSAREE